MSAAVSPIGTRVAPTRPIDSLRREHTNMRGIMVLIGRQLDLIEAETGNDWVLLLNALYYMRKFPSLIHHPKEDAIFGRLAVLEPAWKAEVEALRQQHQEIYRLEDWLLETALGSPRAGSDLRKRLVEFGRHYIELQREHSETEERVLFPQALVSLKPGDWEQIGRRFRDMSDPVFGEQVEERFHLLYEHLLHEAAGQ